MSFAQKIASLFIAGTIILSGFLFILPRAYAEENLLTVLKEVVNRVIAIGGIKNNDSLSGEEKRIKELQTRKEALYRIFDLTLLEDNDLKNKLNSLKNLNEKQKELRNELLSTFGENENAYAEMKKRLKDLDTITSVKQLAIDFKNWRNLVYNPKVEKIIAFTLIFQEKNILDIASQRLEKIKSDLEKLEDAKSIQKEDTADLLQKALLSINQAKDSNRQAEIIITEILKNELNKLAQSNSVFSKNKEKELLLSSKNLVEESLKQIKNAYKIFIDIGKLVKEKLAE